MPLRESPASSDGPQAAPVVPLRTFRPFDFWVGHKDSILWCALLLVCLFVVRLIFLEAP